jgi:hypothetical protein
MTLLGPGYVAGVRRIQTELISKIIGFENSH